MFKNKSEKSPMEHHKTKPEDRVHPLVKIVYGSGMIPFALLTTGYALLVNPIFNVNMKVSPVMIGLIIGLCRFWDAINDPIMGQISDSTRSRFGRRRPWILLGSFTAAFSFIAIWWFPRGQSDIFYGIWLTVTSLVFYVGLTIYTVPYIALGMEMSPDYHERTRIVAYRDFISPLGSLLAGSLFWFASWNIYSDVVKGMRFTAIGVGAVVIVIGVLTAIFPREHSFSIRSRTQEKIGLLTSVKLALQVKPFLILCGTTMVLMLACMLVGSFGFYVLLYYVFGGDQSKVGWLMALGSIVTTVFSILIIPVIVKISTKIGKKNTIILFICFSIVGALSKWWCITPELPYLSLVVPPLEGMGYIAQSVLINSMLPDVVDYDELRTHTRREGMFSAVYGWSWKMGIALALMVSGVILTSTGYSADLETQLPSTVTKLRLLYTIVPLFGFLSGMLLIWKYPLNEKKVYESLAELETRHASASSETDDAD